MTIVDTHIQYSISLIFMVLAHVEYMYQRLNHNYCLVFLFFIFLLTLHLPVFSIHFFSFSWCWQMCYIILCTKDLTITFVCHLSLYELFSTYLLDKSWELGEDKADRTSGTGYLSGLCVQI